MLSSIRTELGSQWRYIGYNLGLEDCVLNIVEQDYRKAGDQAFNMLKMWIEKDVESCYCKLISAMNEEGLRNEIETLKKRIKASKLCV